MPQWRAVRTTYELQAPLIPLMREQPLGDTARRGLFPGSCYPPLLGIEWANVNAFITHLRTAPPDLRSPDARDVGSTRSIGA